METQEYVLPVTKTEKIEADTPPGINPPAPLTRVSEGLADPPQLPIPAAASVQVNGSVPAIVIKREPRKSDSEKEDRDKRRRSRSR